MFVRPARSVLGVMRSKVVRPSERLHLSVAGVVNVSNTALERKQSNHATSFLPCAPFRAMHTSPRQRIDILPDADKPRGQTKESEPHHHATEATPLTDSQYQSKADEYMEGLLVKLQHMEESGHLSDVEYSAGVLRVETSNHGIYVLNKQPPNKQIWLSSPISGPKRFDWVVLGESMHHKEGAGSGDWIYLRDGSSLSKLLKRELRVEMDEPHEMPEGAR